MPTCDDVVAIGLRVPEVEVGTSFGRAVAEGAQQGDVPDALVPRVIDVGEREALV